MKKGWSILGAAAAIVTLAPWKVTQDEEETRLYALTWEAGIGRDAEGKLHVTVKPGLHDPRSLLTQDEAAEETEWQDTAAEEPAEDAPAAEPEAPAAPVLDPEEAADYADVPDPYGEAEAAL